VYRLCRRSSLLLFLPLGACHPATPGALMGESAHFRLFVDPALGPLPSTSEVSGDLAALETDWSDKQTMLKMPDGKISYHLLTPGHILDACDFTEFAASTEVACEQSDLLEVDAGYLPFQHELIHAYMALLAPHGRQIPFIAEGAAQALGCDVSNGTPYAYQVPWQQAVVEVPGAVENDDYIEGGLFARSLIRTYGIDQYVRYYRQAPELRDVALFATNFEAFWQVSLDDAWAAMHLSPNGLPNDEAICPCSLPSTTSTAQLASAPLGSAPYWTLPDLTGESVALETTPDQLVLVQDCQGVAPSLMSYGNSDLLIARPASTEGLYVQAPVTGMSAGQYVADSCAATTPYALPADFLAGAGILSIVTVRPAAAGAAQYLQIQVPAAAHISFNSWVEICDTCAFDSGSCQPSTTSPTTGAVQGTFYVKLTTPPVSPGDPPSNQLNFALAFAN
jgi:hypothetical protein